MRSNQETDAILAAWDVEKIWRPYRTQIAHDGDGLLIRLGPRRGGLFQTGGWRGLVVIIVSLLLSLTLLLFANDEWVTMAVTGVFGVVGLFVTGLAAYFWVRIVEVRVRSGSLSYRCLIFGQAVRTRTLSSMQISDLIIQYSQLFLMPAEGQPIEIIDSIHDHELLDELRRVINNYLAPV